MRLSRYQGIRLSQKQQQVNLVILPDKNQYATKLIDVLYCFLQLLKLKEIRCAAGIFKQLLQEVEISCDQAQTGHYF